MLGLAAGTAPEAGQSRAEHAVAVVTPSPLRFREEKATAMPRAAVARLLSLSRRRGYAAVAAESRAPAATAMAARAPGVGGATDGAALSSSKEAFWMRDPQTGCWAPEDRFADVDAAELRARLLARKD